MDYRHFTGTLKVGKYSISKHTDIRHYFLPLSSKVVLMVSVVHKFVKIALTRGRIIQVVDSPTSDYAYVYCAAL